MAPVLGIDQHLSIHDSTTLSRMPQRRLLNYLRQQITQRNSVYSVYVALGADSNAAQRPMTTTALFGLSFTGRFISLPNCPFISVSPLTF